VLVSGAAALILSITGAWAGYHHPPTSDDVPSAQYMNVAPLPGAGTALNSLGDPDGLGAFQVNIPVAYTPRWGYVSAGVFKGDHPHTPGTGFGNGTGILGAAFGNYPSVYVSGLQASEILEESKCLSLQVSVLRENDTTPALAVGVQDLLEKEARMQSLYFVATKTFRAGSRPVYATAGFGGGRFLDGPIGGVSTPLTESLNAALEWDGYQINTGLGWRPGGRKGWFTLLGGYNGRTGLVFGGTAAFKL